MVTIKSIGVDVDGVLIDMMKLFCAIYNTYYWETEGFTIKSKEDIKKWEFYEDWDLIDKEDTYFLFDECNQNLYYAPALDKLCRKFLAKINKRAEVHIITGRPEKYIDNLMFRLKHLGLVEGIHYKDVQLLGYDLNNKLELGYDIYIDDNPKMAEKLKEIKETKKNGQILLLYDQNWNKNIPNSRGIRRVHNWREIWQMIQRLLV